MTPQTAVATMKLRTIALSYAKVSTAPASRSASRPMAGE